MPESGTARCQGSFLHPPRTPGLTASPARKSKAGSTNAIDDHTGLVEQANADARALLEPLFQGRKLLLCGNIAVGLRGLARELVGLGAARPFLIAGSAGTGELPSTDEAELHLLGIESGDILTEHRKLHRALDDLPANVRTALDAWDPNREAHCIVQDFLAVRRSVAGRRAYGGRPPAWAELEDKVRIDAFWDAVGVRRAASRIVPADYNAARSAAQALDRGDGTVWAADASGGVHGGGLGLRWVRPGDDGRDAFAQLAEMADRLRVMPFLEGIPASIHGIVLPDTVPVFRPVEMVTLRAAAGHRLHYSGCATAFDPRPADREAMRAIARRVGVALREKLDYRGPFGIDGVLAAEGFLPTELNPRGGAAYRPLSAGLGAFPLTALRLAIIEGDALSVRPDLLERAIVESADATRTAAGWSATSTKFEDNAAMGLVRDGDEYRAARADEDAEATLSFGPGPIGGFLRFRLHDDRVTPGPSVAPEVARAYRFADRALGTDFGPLSPPINVRP